MVKTTPFQTLISLFLNGQLLLRVNCVVSKSSFARTDSNCFVRIFFFLTILCLTVMDGSGEGIEQYDTYDCVRVATETKGERR